MHSECVISREKNIKSCKRSVNSYSTFSIRSNSNIRSNGFVNSFFELWLTKNETLKDLFLAKLEPLLISSFWFSLRNGVKSFEKKARKHQNILQKTAPKLGSIARQRAARTRHQVKKKNIEWNSMIRNVSPSRRYSIRSLDYWLVCVKRTKTGLCQ